jgi:hypothetical protein
MIVYDKENFIKKAIERTAEEWQKLAKESTEIENFVYYITLARLREVIDEKDIEKQDKLVQELRCLSFMLQD